MLVNYTTRDQMVQIFSKHKSKDKRSRMGRRLCKLTGQAGEGYVLTHLHWHHGVSVY
jgi:hypothetical protein